MNDISTDSEHPRSPQSETYFRFFYFQFPLVFLISIEKILLTKLIPTVLHPATNLNGRKIPTRYYMVSPETSDSVGNYLVKIGAIMISTKSM